MNDSGHAGRRDRGGVGENGMGRMSPGHLLSGSFVAIIEVVAHRIINKVITTYYFGLIAI